MNKLNIRRDPFIRFPAVLVTIQCSAHARPIYTPACYVAHSSVNWVA